MDGSTRVQINRSASEVFDYLSDLEKAPEFVPSLISVRKVSTGDVGVGTRYEEVVDLAGRRGEGTLEVTAYDPPRLLAHKGEGGPASFTTRFTVEPDGDDACTVTQEYSVKLSGFGGKLIAPLVSRAAKSSNEAAAANLKKILETGRLD